ncbi:MAG: D-sedoheptulose 7-phosphate isomerase [Bacteroidales bacterium]|nr:MAG: D-sedoheptulose 7-phosphate isomerase [Bacteroidales bacterium]
MDLFESIFNDAGKMLDRFASVPENLRILEEAGKRMVESLRAGKKIIACGNGGSMCDAMHFAEELTGRFRDNRPPVAAIAISDPAYITCTANDYGFDLVFARYIEGLGSKGDVLLAISTSGNSPNIVNAVKSAKDMEMIVIGLTGEKGGKMTGFCDLVIKTPHSPYSDRIQEIHIKVIHSLIHYIEKNLFQT